VETPQHGEPGTSPETGSPDPAPDPADHLPAEAPFETQPASPIPLWAATLLVIGLAWVGDIGAGVFAVAGSTALKSLGIPRLSGWPLHAPVLVAASFMSWGWCLLAIWFLGCRLHRKSISESLALRNPGVAHLSTSVVLGLALAAVGAFLSVRWGRMDTSMAKMGSTPMGLFWIAIMALPIGGFEEIYYRGFIFPRLKRGLGALLGELLPGAGEFLAGLGALGIIVIWFGLIHLQQLVGTGSVDWMSLGTVTFAGLIFTLQRWGSRSLLPSLITHVTYNSTLIAFSVAQAFSQETGGAGAG